MTIARIGIKERIPKPVYLLIISKKCKFQGRGLVSTLKGCIEPRRQWLSLQDDISLEIPSRHGGTVVKYLGFLHLNPLESAMNLAKPKYLITSSKGSRYPS
jgi:hypothetical protein